LASFTCCEVDDGNELSCDFFSSAFHASGEFGGFIFHGSRISDGCISSATAATADAPLG
jgi:hypothetical protein